MTWRGHVLFVSFAVMGGSCATAQAPDGEGDGEGVPFIPTDENGASVDLPVGGQARVIADSLSLRETAGPSSPFLAAMPCGAWVKVLAGPSESPVSGWWNVTYSGPNAVKFTGWASGKYLMAATVFDKTTCGAPIEVPDLAGQDLAGVDLAGADLATASSPDLSTPVVAPLSEVDAIFARAKLGVGYSYWWGHGAWRPDGANRGTCTGSCPSCTHSDSYGADCSGFLSKVWQVPGPSALSVDQHPYSTYNFYNEETHWKRISRDDLKPADALTRRDASTGHIVLVEKATDPYGAITVYESRACAAGVVYNTRTIDSSYRAIRKDGL